MHHGQLVASGPPIGGRGTTSGCRTGHVAASPTPARLPLMHGRRGVRSITFHDQSGGEVISASTGTPLIARVHYRVDAPVSDAVVEVFYYSRDGRVLHCQQSTALTGGAALTCRWVLGPSNSPCHGMGLQPGIYSVGATIRQRTAAEDDRLVLRPDAALRRARQVGPRATSPHRTTGASSPETDARIMARTSRASPLVSVVVPCFNHGHFLREALASVGTPDVTTGKSSSSTTARRTRRRTGDRQLRTPNRFNPSGSRTPASRPHATAD